MKKGEIAKNLFSTGINCSQAVALAFKEEMGLSEEQIKKLSIGYGGGFGRQRLVCGAVCGMTMVLSYLLSDGNDKLSIYSVIQEASAIVKAELGSLICSELLEGKVKVETSPKPDERTAEYYKKRPCAEIVEFIANVTEDIITKYKK